MTPKVLDRLLGDLRAIPHVEIIRIGTRMPVVLRPDELNCWLDPTLSASAVGEVVSQAQDGFQSHPVSTRVNNTRNESADLIAPIER